MRTSTSTVSCLRGPASARPTSATQMLLDAGIPSAVVVPPRDIAANPQLRYRGLFEMEEHAVTGAHEIPTLPFRFSRVDRWLRVAGADPWPRQRRRPRGPRLLACKDRGLAASLASSATSPRACDAVWRPRAVAARRAGSGVRLTPPPLGRPAVVGLATRGPNNLLDEDHLFRHLVAGQRGPHQTSSAHLRWAPSRAPTERQRPHAAPSARRARRQRPRRRRRETAAALPSTSSG